MPSKILRKITIAILLSVFASAFISIAGQGGFADFFAVYAATTTEDVVVDVEFPNPITDDTLDKVVDSLINFVFTLALIICPLVIIIGGFIFVTAGGDPKRVEIGRQIILWALVGLTIAMLAKGAVVLLRAILGV